MNDALASPLSGRSIALRVLPAALVLGMLIVGPPKALRQPAAERCVAARVSKPSSAPKLVTAAADATVAPVDLNCVKETTR